MTTQRRVPVGTTVQTLWGPAVVTVDLWPDDPNYEITYTDESQCPGVVGAFEHLYVPIGPVQRSGRFYSFGENGPERIAQR